jgi:lipid A ethanolaminephosphotransferase
MGNHGPAYYKRYAASFEIFKPACQTNQLQKCSIEEINNAYDNAITYTDYFLAHVISLLKNNSSLFETTMFYISDHGESLGEHGLYLHGFPYMLAPEEQRHVAAIMWFGNSFKIDQAKLLQKRDKPYSHDNIFHTLLGLMEVQTNVYKKSMDILNSAD